MQIIRMCGLLGWASLLFCNSALYAQGPPFQCSANGGVGAPVLSEGLAELVGDLVVSCSGGTPTAFGALVPAVNIQVSLNTGLTSQLLTTSTTGPQYSEALLLVDEPAPANQFVCSTPSTGCSAYGIGAGNSSSGYYGNGTIGASNGSCVLNASIAGCPGNNRNVLQGIQTGPNVVTFFGVPIDPPGVNSRTFRVTNIRADANALGPFNPSMPTAIVETVSTNPASLPVSNPSQTVAFIQQGAFASLSAAPGFSQCSSQNQALADDPTQSGAAQFNIRFSEEFATAFKQRNVATSPSAPYALANQNNLTVGGYNTESGFVNLGFPSLPGDNVWQAGLPSQGTRLLVNFQNIPAGVSLFTQVSPPVSGPDVIRLTNAATDGVGGFFPIAGNTSGIAPITLAFGSGVAVFEDLQSDPLTFATVTIPIYVAYDATSGLPTLGSGVVSAGLAPVSALTSAATGPIPRFAVGADLAGQTAFTINSCACASNMSAPIAVTRAGFFFNFATHQFQQKVTIQNTGTNIIAGPISLALDNLNAGTSLVNATGATSCAGPSGSPYIGLNVGSALTPGASASVVLQFTHIGAGGITYNTRILAGSGGR